MKHKTFSSFLLKKFHLDYFSTEKMIWEERWEPLSHSSPAGGAAAPSPPPSPPPIRPSMHCTALQASGSDIACMPWCGVHAGEPGEPRPACAKVLFSSSRVASCNDSVLFPPLFEIGTVPTYFHKHIRLWFSFACSATECAASFLKPRHVSSVCACCSQTLTSTFRESFVWRRARFRRRLKSSVTLRAPMLIFKLDNFYILAFNVCCDGVAYIIFLVKLDIFILYNTGFNCYM